MFKTMLIAASLVAVASTGAFAYEGQTTKIIRTSPDGLRSKTIIHRHVNRYGDLVTKRRTMTEGSGSSTVITRRSTLDPAAGGSTTVTRGEH